VGAGRPQLATAGVEGRQMLAAQALVQQVAACPTPSSACPFPV
jgi:hypothetical protein